ncbi:monocyte to macrophage differentiation factor-like [Mya arenaria]|uniref:monocyte to macrophage differentiation factor-like n=1 Tax=Mya arenaria TaxID=6604 RepID=UPI0022E4181C|nr:monocyte to macrophage differentiation factor-like [Mya arenaria]XP_052771039.1 monocyte to macrophage differentiation factor-like [Mya arenaria]
MLRRNISFSVDTSKLKNERASHGEHYKPTDLEHLANMFTHGICIFPSLYGLKIMQERASSPTEVAALLIYGMALFFLFTTSTMYHSLSFARTKSKLKHCLHIGDRAVIYIFIAASYTPWLLLKDFGGVDNFFMWVVWVGAVLGIIYQFLFHSKYKSLEVVFYLIIGICPAYAVTHMTDPSGVHELAVGGVIYVAGVLFFKCDGIIPFAHAIWHCFVFLGAFVHFYAINTYLVGQHGKTENIVDRMV